MDLTDALSTESSFICSTESESKNSIKSVHTDEADSTGTADTSKAVEVAHHFGRNIRLAMACMDGAERLQRIKAAKAGFEKRRAAGLLSADTSANLVTNSSAFAMADANRSHPTRSIRQLSSELHKISAQIDTHRAELVELLFQFDQQQGWAESGARHCADWANAHLGIAKSSAYNFLRVGRKLRELPMISALFRGGELSWSKVKLLVDVADADNERDLAHVSLSATVSDVERICREFRWPKREESQEGDPVTGRTAADLRSEHQFNHRSLTWHEQHDGSVLIKINLPPEKAQAVLKSLEYNVNELYEGSSAAANKRIDDAQGNGVSTCETHSKQANRPTINQCRADAMVLMAERSLQQASTDISRSDRYQVIIHVDNQDFIASNNSNASSVAAKSKQFPRKLPWIEGAGPMSDTVARRLSCDASVVSIIMNDGEPLTVGRKTRTWPTAIWRAIVTRDRHCQFPGCSEHRHLDVHHIKHWADGGETSVENGLCLCHRHHSLVHEGGYVVERNTVVRNTQLGSKNFGTTIGLVSKSKKALLPTRHRFRFIKPNVSRSEQIKSDNKCNEFHPAYLCVYKHE